MNNNFFETESAHSNIMYWWHGVIVDDSFWAGCSDDETSNENSRIHIAKKLEERPKKGWGKRYKVAIIGRHYDVKADPKEADLLEMAEVVYPVTAGSGLGGTKQTAALRQGTHVIGFYADGKEGRNPIILGAFGVNEQNEPIVYPGDPPRFFQVRSATKGVCGERIKPLGEKDQNPNRTEIHANDSPLQASKAFDTKSKDGGIVENISSTTKCEKSTGIINQIKTLLNKLSYIVNVAKRGSSDLTANLSNIISSITSGITGLANGLMDRMRGYITNKINNGVKDLMNLLPPFLRPNFNSGTQSTLSALSCAFNKIKNGIYKIVDELIKQFIDNYINAPLCAATNFLGSLLGNVIGQVNGIVGSALSAINGLLDVGFGISDKALDVLDFVLDVLSLFDCDKDNPECPGTTQWSFWRGPNEVSSSIQTKVSATVNEIIGDVETALPGSAEGAKSNPCNSRQIPCGPPTIQISGGGGSGARANPVISVTGRILGLDFSAFGSEYTSPPRIDVVDSCGTGGGAVIRAVMRPTGTFNEFDEEILDLVGAVVLDSGTQYIPAPNGTSGGNGLIISRPNDTIIFKTGTTQIINGKEVPGVGYDVYENGNTISVRVNDEIYLPSGTLVNVYNQLGEVVQTLSGLGQQTRLTIQADGTLTTPFNPDNTETVPEIEYPLTSEDSPPITDKSSYPIVAEIESVFIKNPGFGYNPNDNILVSNNKGALLDFRVNDSGEVIEVSVINGGLGFTDVPYIFIESQTGYNFEAIPVFKFTQLSDINLNNITPPPGAKLISVIDCVGKIH